MHPWILALWLSSAPATPSDGWVLVERVVAIVDDEVVLVSELDRRVVQARVAVDKLKDPTERDRRRAALPGETLGTIVEEQLVDQAAARLAISIDESTVDAALAEVRSFNKIDDAAFVRALADGGWTMHEYRLGMRRELTRFKLMSVLFASSLTISDEAVSAAYTAEKLKNPGLGDLASQSEHLRAVLFERAMAETYTRWLGEARSNAHVELRL